MSRKVFYDISEQIPNIPQPAREKFLKKLVIRHFEMKDKDPQKVEKEILRNEIVVLLYELLMREEKFGDCQADVLKTIDWLIRGGDE